MLVCRSRHEARLANLTSPAPSLSRELTLLRLQAKRLLYLCAYSPEAHHAVTHLRNALAQLDTALNALSTGTEGASQASREGHIDANR